MISCQAFLQSNLIIIRPTDQRLTSNLGTKAHLSFISTLMASIDLTNGIKGTNVLCIKLHKVFVEISVDANYILNLKLTSSFIDSLGGLNSV